MASNDGPNNDVRKQYLKIPHFLTEADRTLTLNIYQTVPTPYPPPYACRTCRRKHAWELLFGINQTPLYFLRVLDRASSSYLNNGRPTWWHLLYYVNLLLNMFPMLIYPSSGVCDYLVRCCLGWLDACWCYVAGLAVGDVVSECRLHSDTTSPTANPAT